MTMFSSQWFASPGVDAGYEVDYSCRFNDDDSATLSKTYSGAGTSDKISQIEFWFKRGLLATERYIFSVESNSFQIAFDANDKLNIFYFSSSYLFRLHTTQVFRDPHAWYHLTLHLDTTPSTPSASSMGLLINGVAVTAFDTATYPSQNQAMGLGTATNFNIGSNNTPASYYDGYISYFLYCDGNSSSTPYSAEFDSNGVWRPKDASSATFGDNGFWLDFAVAPDTGNGAGNDVSGNNNDFTDSAGLAAADRVVDTPTNNWANITSIGGDPGNVTSDGNLNCVIGATDKGMAWSSMIFDLEDTTGWYWEITPKSAGGSTIGAWAFGACAPNVPNGTADADSRMYLNNPSGKAYDDVLMFAVKGGAMWVGKDGTWDNSATNAEIAAGTTTNAAETGLTGFAKTVVSHGHASTATLESNYGQIGFTHASDQVAAGLKALNTTNLAVPSIADPSAHFQPNTRTGDGSAGAVSQTGNSQFGTDLIIIKNRDQADEWKVVDSVRGATYEINTDSTNAQSTDSNGVTAFSATDGYTIGTGAGGYNDNTEKFIDYHFQEGSTPGMGINASVSHTQGSATNIAHGMGLVPAFAMVKETDAATAWWIFHKDLTSKTGNYLAFSTAGEASITDVWGTQSSTNFVIGDAAGGLASGTYVCYSFAEVAGFSSFGTYDGNGDNNGSLVFLGFKPALLICKAIDRGVTGWFTYDSKRDGYNGVPGNNPLYMNTTAAETTLSAVDVDLLSNGFKCRQTGGPNYSNKFMYAAWAESPFGGHDETFGNGVAPSTAR